MTLRSLPLAVLLLSLPAFAAAQPGAAAPAEGSRATQEQLKTIDGALAQASAIVKDLESMATGGVDGTGCPPSFSISDYMRDMREKKNAKITGDDIRDEDGKGPKLDWQFFYLCRAVATNSPESCAEADSITPKTLKRGTNYREGLQNPNAMTEDQALAMQSSSSYAGKCRFYYYQSRLTQAYISKDPKFMQICDAAAPHLASIPSPQAADPVCRAMRAYTGDPEAFVRALNGAVSQPFKREYALGVLDEMTAKPGACAKISRPYSHRLCEETSAYRSALAAKKSAVCGRRGLCRVLMGEPKFACELYLRDVKKEACGLVYSKSFLETRAASFKTLTDQIQTYLGGSGAGLGDVKDLKAFNARLDRLFQLRRRFQQASDAIAPEVVRASGKKRARR
jgi:hypothetical protein